MANLHGIEIPESVLVQKQLPSHTAGHNGVSVEEISLLVREKYVGKHYLVASNFVPGRMIRVVSEDRKHQLLLEVHRCQVTTRGDLHIQAYKVQGYPESWVKGGDKDDRT